MEPERRSLVPRLPTGYETKSGAHRQYASVRMRNMLRCACAAQGYEKYCTCFSHNRSRTLPSGVFQFIGSPLCFSESVTHLGHVLHWDDVTRVTAAMCRQANYLLHTFAGCGMLVKTKLIVSHCLSLYGCVLWSYSCVPWKLLSTIIILGNCPDLNATHVYFTVLLVLRACSMLYPIDSRHLYLYLKGRLRESLQQRWYCLCRVCTGY